MKLPNLKTMTFEQLIALRDRAERLISDRASAERRALQDKLDRLSKYEDAPVKGRKRGSSLKGRKVPPKYRNPKDASQTWAGRGVSPRWVKDLLAKGRKLEDFAIQKGRRAMSKAGMRRKKSS